MDWFFGDFDAGNFLFNTVAFLLFHEMFSVLKILIVQLFHFIFKVIFKLNQNEILQIIELYYRDVLLQPKSSFKLSYRLKTRKKRLFAYKKSIQCFYISFCMFMGMPGHVYMCATWFGKKKKKKKHTHIPRGSVFIHNGVLLKL